ncbi:hypothetical protein Syun_006310 [Stephania yunnanensis]|uniref:Acyl-[acyl-carrier-protein] hydrolase n=1 Tax=Stephania yunnanensis TaxID=152371 RepID=A0AAP0PZ67_9MAGN
MRGSSSTAAQTRAPSRPQTPVFGSPSLVFIPTVRPGIRRSDGGRPGAGGCGGRRDLGGQVEAREIGGGRAVVQGEVHCQEVACNHAQSVGFSTDGFATTTTMRKMHLIWVTNRMHIEVYKYPAWGDVVEIETWCQAEGRIGTRRDWIIKDVASGYVIGRATSKWVMMNQDTRRLQKVSDEVKEEYLVFCPRTPRLAFPEEDNSSLKKISKLEDPAQYSKLGLVPRRADLDMNQHVNNVTYIGWVLESIPQEIIDSHELEKITLDYRRECQHDDIVDSLASPELEDAEVVLLQEGANGSASSKKLGEDSRQFLHFLRLSRDGLEMNRGRTEWRRKLKR